MGSAYTDVQFAMNRLATDWGVLGHSVLGDDVIDWIEQGKPMGTPRMICNGDIMLHVTKGVFGLRIDNVLNVELNNVEIDDLQNIAELGSYICGNYDSTNTSLATSTFAFITASLAMNLRRLTALMSFALFISTSAATPAMRALISSVIVISLMRGVCGDIDCYGAYECVDSVITNEVVWARGYRSVAHANISNEAPSYWTDCDGARSCESAVSIKSYSLRCEGANACAHSRSIHCGLGFWSRGLLSGANVTVVSDKQHCDGVLSCFESTFNSSGGLLADAAHSLQGAQIFSSQTASLNMRAHYAGYKASFTCFESDGCSITCYDSGCYGLYIDCIGDCTINPIDDATAPITNLSEFAELIPDTLFDAHGLAALAETISTECDAMAEAGDVTYDDFEGIADITYDKFDRRVATYPDYLLVTEDEGPLCCRGSEACGSEDDGVRNPGIVVNHSLGVLCSGWRSCYETNIETNGPVLCTGSHSCGSGGIISTDVVHCAGAIACHVSSITAPIVYCSGRRSCEKASLTSDGDGYMDIFFLGYYSASQYGVTTLSCTAGDSCTAHCLSDEVSKCDTLETLGE